MMVTMLQCQTHSHNLRDPGNRHTEELIQFSREGCTYPIVSFCPCVPDYFQGFQGIIVDCLNEEGSVSGAKHHSDMSQSHNWAPKQNSSEEANLQ